MTRKWSFIYEFDIQDWTLCICGLSAIVISVIGFIGYWPFEQNDLDAFNKVMFFAIGLIISALVSIFYIVKQIFKRIDIQNIKSYKTSFPIDDLYKDILSADRISICGIEMFNTIGNVKSILKQKAKQKVDINFLIADPDGDVIKMVKKKYTTNISGTSKRIKDTINLMKEIKEISPDNVQILKLDYLFPRKVIILGKSKYDGIAYISNYTFRMSKDKSKAIYRMNEGNYYTFFLNEFNLMWDCAKNERDSISE